jgi:hypothetical protein
MTEEQEWLLLNNIPQVILLSLLLLSSVLPIVVNTNCLRPTTMPINTRCPLFLLLLLLLFLALTHSTTAQPQHYKGYPACVKNISPSSISASDPTHCADVSISDTNAFYSCVCNNNTFMQASTAVILRTCGCGDLSTFAAAVANNCGIIDPQAPLGTAQAVVQLGDPDGTCAADEATGLQKTSNQYGLIFGIIGAVGVAASILGCTFWQCCWRNRKTRVRYSHKWPA